MSFRCRRGVRPPTAMTQPPLPISCSFPILPHSLLLTGVRRYHPRENFGIKDSCRWFLEHLDINILSNKKVINRLTSLFCPPRILRRHGAFGRAVDGRCHGLCLNLPFDRCARTLANGWWRVTSPRSARLHWATSRRAPLTSSASVPSTRLVRDRRRLPPLLLNMVSSAFNAVKTDAREIFFNSGGQNQVLSCNVIRYMIFSPHPLKSCWLLVKHKGGRTWMQMINVLL